MVSTVAWGMLAAAVLPQAVKLTCHSLKLEILITLLCVPWHQVIHQPPK